MVITAKYSQDTHLNQLLHGKYEANEFAKKRKKDRECVLIFSKKKDIL